MLQDLLPPGAIKSALGFPRLPTDSIDSATDFQVYKDVAGISGSGFGFADGGRVYHTKVSFYP